MFNVEKCALMSPNPRGMLEDFAAGFLYVSSSLRIFNSLLNMIQG